MKFLGELEMISTFSAPFIRVGYIPETSDNVVITAEEEIEDVLKMSEKLNIKPIYLGMKKLVIYTHDPLLSIVNFYVKSVHFFIISFLVWTSQKDIR